MNCADLSTVAPIDAYAVAYGAAHPHSIAGAWLSSVEDPESYGGLAELLTTPEASTRWGSLDVVRSDLASVGDWGIASAVVSAPEAADVIYVKVVAGSRAERVITAIDGARAARLITVIWRHDVHRWLVHDFGPVAEPLASLADARRSTCQGCIGVLGTVAAHSLGAVRDQKR